MKKYLLSIIILFAFSMSFAQNKKDILLTVDGKPVYISEFKRVYNKNLNLVQDPKQKSVDGYLDLFIDYKLKVAEAYEQKLDQSKSYISEFNKYRDQLSRSYIFEDKITGELAKEAYERGLEEINANHILILSSYEDTPQDTLKAYNKIKAIYKKAKAGEDFEALAKANSEEPNANESAGYLGYFSVFTMVYPFETMAYNTEKDEVSEIVRTQFGYHIIKVNDRRKRVGQITVSHIMISANRKDSAFNPKARIDELSVLIRQGESFENLAMQYSDDKNSAKNSGKLQKFRKGDLRAIEFEDAAYNLKNPGDISRPVKTKFGWHIIRLEEKHAIPSFEEERETLEQKTKGGLRSKVVTSAVNKIIKEKYNYIEVEDYRPFFENYVTEDVLKRKWQYDTLAPAQDKILFSIADKKLRYNDFASFISERQGLTSSYKQKSSMLAGFYDEFETLELKNYFKENLEFENEDYAATISEYRNGLLIFDVMNQNIWMKAKSDSIGLQKYYKEIKGKYQWKERVDADIVSSSDNDIVVKAKDLLSLGKTAEEIKETLNTNDKVNVLTTKGIFEKGQRELPDNFEAKKGVSEVYANDDGFSVIRVTEVFPPGSKDLKEIKGKVMSDYQNFLEEEWMKELRQKYKVEIHKKALKKVKKELNS